MSLPNGNRARMVLACGIALASATLFCAVLLMWNDRQAQIGDWSRNLANTSTTIAAHAEQTLRGADLVLERVQDLIKASHVGTEADVHTLLSTRNVHDGLRLIVAGTPQVDVASIISADGEVVNFTRSFPPPPINLSDRDFYKAIMAGGVTRAFLSVPVHNRGTTEWAFYLARPIAGPGGKPLGLVVAGLTSAFFEDFYKAISLGDRSAISLFRLDGTLLAREPMPTDMTGMFYGDDPLFKQMLGVSAAGQNGENDLGKYPAGPPRPDGTSPLFDNIFKSGPDPLRSEEALATEFTDKGRLYSPRRVHGFPVLSNSSVSMDVMLSGWRHTFRNVTLLTLGVIIAMLSLTLVLARLFDRQDRTLKDLIAARMEAEAGAQAKTSLLETLHVSQAQLSQQSEVLQVALEHIDQGLMMVAADGTVPVCNRRAMELLDLPQALMARRPPFRAVVDHQRDTGEFVNSTIHKSHVPGAAQMMTAQTTYERVRPNGTVLEVQTIPLPGGGMVRTFSDITARRRSEEQIRFNAHHDGLTELVNRMVFQQSLSDAIADAAASQRTLAVHYLDLDGFKLVNDTHGHAVGDLLLIDVARRLRRAVRNPETVGRMGGDEFAILQPLPDRPGAYEHLAQRVLAVISEPYLINGLRCTVGLSIGIALFPDHGQAAEELLRDADVALYRAKANGKGTFCLFDEAMDRRQQSAFQLEQDLNQALSNDQFFLEYQPIVDATTLLPSCFEVLLRWRHPKHGVVPPGAFISIAERSGLIVPVGQWVLETACREATNWPPTISLSVNVSPVQFSRGNLPGQVAVALKRSGLPPHRLTLEVTEGLLLEETDTVLTAMSSLRALGVRFSLDDFGTAHSRLTYLRRFPFDVIKIDRSFVEDSVEQEGARAIVSAMLAIGRAFHLSVVAEGVERSSQLDLLRGMGCNLIQGYLTGRPRPAAALPRIAQRDSIRAPTA